MTDHVPGDQPTKSRKATHVSQKKPARFAEGTDVPVSKTRQDIETMLGKHGAHNCISGSDFQTRAGFVAFSLDGRQIRYQLRPYEPHEGPGRQRHPEQYEREMWRALLLVIKGKLEAVRSGVVTTEQEFLANIVMPDGKLLGQELAPAIHRMYESGKVAPMLPEWSGG